MILIQLIVVGIMILILLMLMTHGRLFDTYGTSVIFEKLNNHRTGQVKFLWNKWAEFFQDKQYENGFYKVTFRYYGGIWHLAQEDHLFWIWEHEGRNPILDPVYKSKWSYFRYDFNAMKYIMENHPNLIHKRNHLKPEDKKPIIVDFKKVMHETDK